MHQYLSVAPVASLIFVITVITTLLTFSNESWYGKLMLHPYSVYRGRNVYTLLTSGLIHKDWMHMFFNMFSYFFFAFQLELTIGHWQFGVLYILSMILSDLPSVIKHKDDFWYNSLGASGAISAVIFSSILYHPLDKMMILPIPFAIPAIIFGVLYLVYCNYASKYSRDNINHDAHLFGALSGIGITVLLNVHVISTFIEQIRMAI